MKRLFIIIIFFQITYVNFAFDNKTVFYKNQISYLYLYQENIELLFIIYKNNIWPQEKLINKLNTSLSLIQGILNDLNLMKITNYEKDIHKTITRITSESLKLTKIFISGLDSNNNDWLKSFIKAKKHNAQEITKLTEMEE
ncbi:MAG: hypothetical protein OEV44_12380 [Spirochaetota bacterium]|nr:hypothetical protein [Spirochaetota bacterium]